MKGFSSLAPTGESSLCQRLGLMFTREILSWSSQMVVVFLDPPTSWP